MQTSIFRNAPVAHDANSKVNLLISLCLIHEVQKILDLPVATVDALVGQPETHLARLGHQIGYEPAETCTYICKFT